MLLCSIAISASGSPGLLLSCSKMTNNNIFAHNHYTNNNPYIFLHLYIYKSTTSTILSATVGQNQKIFSLIRQVLASLHHCPIASTPLHAQTRLDAYSRVIDDFLLLGKAQRDLCHQTVKSSLITKDAHTREGDKDFKDIKDARGFPTPLSNAKTEGHLFSVIERVETLVSDMVTPADRVCSSISTTSGTDPTESAVKNTPVPGSVPVPVGLKAAHDDHFTRLRALLPTYVRDVIGSVCRVGNAYGSITSSGARLFKATDVRPQQYVIILFLMSQFEGYCSVISIVVCHTPHRLVH